MVLFQQSCCEVTGSSPGDSTILYVEVCILDRDVVRDYGTCKYGSTYLWHDARNPYERQIGGYSIAYGLNAVLTRGMRGVWTS